MPRRYSVLSMYLSAVKGLFRIVLKYLLIAIIAVNGINIVEIAAALATLLGPPGLSLNRKPSPTLRAVRRIRKVLKTATRTGEANGEGGTTLFTKF